MLPEDPERADRPPARGSVEIPAFGAGGRVDETGLALVHEGEWIMPAPGSEATISPAGMEGGVGPVINYFFPVEIEVVGELSQAEMERVARFVFAAIEAEISARL